MPGQAYPSFFSSVEDTGHQSRASWFLRVVLTNISSTFIWILVYRTHVHPWQQDSFLWGHVLRKEGDLRKNSPNWVYPIDLVRHLGILGTGPIRKGE